VKTLLPHGAKFEDRLLPVRYAEPYFRTAAERPLVSCPNLMQVTWVATDLQRVCITVGVLYPNVNELVANGKKISVKSPNRI
jgi:hypothetical protein